MRLPVPFIQLPFAFDTDRLREELRSLSDSDWMGHPSGMVGNSAVALVSHKGGDNDAFGGKMEEGLVFSKVIGAKFRICCLGDRTFRIWVEIA